MEERRTEVYGIKDGDLIGQRTVVGLAFVLTRDAKNRRIWAFLCRCSCGKEDAVSASALKQGNAGSCKECGNLKIGKKNSTHGESGSPIYTAWYNMMQRCTLPTHKVYEHYGGRGITVHESWYKYENFRDWALANGWKKSLQIHRLDNDFGYVNSNCIWITREEHKKIKHERRAA